MTPNEQINVGQGGGPARDGLAMTRAASVICLPGRHLVFRFPMGVWRVYERKCVEFLDRWSADRYLQHFPHFTPRLLGCVELVQHGPWHLDILLAVDLRVCWSQCRTFYQQPLRWCDRIRVCHHLCKDERAAQRYYDSSLKAAAVIG